MIAIVERRTSETTGASDVVAARAQRGLCLADEVRGMGEVATDAPADRSAGTAAVELREESGRVRDVRAGGDDVGLHSAASASSTS